MAEQQPSAVAQQEPEISNSVDATAEPQVPTGLENGVPDAGGYAHMGMPEPLPTTTLDGRTIQIRPCKYFPNCAKMDDQEHNTMYSHTSVVKKPPPVCSLRN